MRAAFCHRCGCCAARSSSDQAAPGGCKVTQPRASVNVAKEKRRRCAVRCVNTEGLLRDSASTWCFAAHAAASFKKVPSGSAVLHSLSKPASVGALSDAAAT